MYSRNEIINKVQKNIVEMDKFYQSEMINYTGKTSDTSELITEVIAGKLLNIGIKNKIASINEIKRENGYHVKSHNGKVTTNISKGDSNRYEERFALDLFNKSKNGVSFNKLGEIIDYQIPLKNKRDDNAGKIDLISKNDENIFLIELKTKDNDETLLRCILEIATYYQILSKKKFIDSYKDKFRNLTEKNIKKTILIAKDSSQHNELKSINNGERKNLKSLVDDLEVQIFVIDEDSLEVE